MSQKICMRHLQKFVEYRRCSFVVLIVYLKFVVRKEGDKAHETSGDLTATDTHPLLSITGAVKVDLVSVYEAVSE